MRKTVTIPAAGETLKINILGKSVYVEAVPIYETIEQVPLLQFELESNNLPIYPDSYYNFGQEFNYLTITGTTDSAGDDLTLVSLDECRESDIKARLLSAPGTTQNETLSDAVFSWTALAIQNAAGKLPKAVAIQSADNAINYAFGVDPNQATPGNGHILPAAETNKENETLHRIEGIAYILSARFINATNGTDSEFIYTFEY